MNENQLLEKFQVEELEKRYEMGRWVSEVKVGVEVENVKVAVTFEV
jgi:hypothetical protein